MIEDHHDRLRGHRITILLRSIPATLPDPCWDDNRPQGEWCTDCRMLNDIRKATANEIEGEANV